MPDIGAGTPLLSQELCKGSCCHFKEQNTKRGWEVKAEKLFCGRSPLHPWHQPANSTKNTQKQYLSKSVVTTGHPNPSHCLLWLLAYVSLWQIKMLCFLLLTHSLADIYQLWAYVKSKVSMFHLLSLVFGPLVMVYPYLPFKQNTYYHWFKIQFFHKTETVFQHLKFSFASPRVTADSRTLWSHGPWLSWGVLQRALLSRRWLSWSWVSKDTYLLQPQLWSRPWSSCKSLAGRIWGWQGAACGTLSQVPTPNWP